MRTTAIMIHGGGALAVCACAALLGACHSSHTTPQLRDARNAYEDAEDSSAATYAADDLRVARRALDRAERAHQDDPGSDREAQLGYLAARKAEIARAHGEMAAAEQAKLRAQADANYQTQLARQANTPEHRAVAAKIDDEDDKVDVEPRRAPARRAAVDRRRDVDRDHRSRDERASAALQRLSQVASVKEEPRGVVITLSGALLFPSGEEELSPIARQSLDQVAEALAAQPDDTEFEVQGHTDDTGSEAQNQQLSKKRAQAVADHLMERDIDRDRIDVVGYGESHPIADNDSEQGRSANRRVEILVRKPDATEDDDS